MSTLDRVFERAFARQTSIPAPHIHVSADKPSLPLGQIKPQQPSPPEWPLPVSRLPGDTLTVATEPTVEPAASATPAACAAFEPPGPCNVEPGTHAAAAEAASLPRRAVKGFDWPELSQALASRVSGRFDPLIAEWQMGRRSAIVAVTSARRGEGSSSVALALAQCSSARGRRTLLIDGDFEHPALATTLGVNADCGWELVLTGEAVLPSALVDSNASHVTFLPLGVSVPRTQLASGAAAEALRALATQFDLVLVDAGPLCDGCEWFAAACFDRVLCVCDRRRSAPQEWEALQRRMRKVGASWDVVENFAGASHV